MRKDDQRMTFSLKYKILLLLILVPSIGILIYSFNIKELILADKKATVLETVLNQSQINKQRIESRLVEAGSFMDYISVGWKSDRNILDEEFIQIFRGFNNISELSIYSSLNNEFKNLFFLSKLRKNFEKSNTEFSVEKGIRVDYRAVDKNMVFFQKNFSGKGILIEVGVRLDNLSKELISTSQYKTHLFSSDLRALSSSASVGSLNEITSYIKESELKSGVYEFKNYIFSLENTSGFTVISVADRDVVYAALKFLNQRSLIFIVLVLSSSLFFSLISTGVVTGNMKKLEEAATSLQEGNFDIDIKIKSNDEIGQFGRTFTKMALKIKTLLSELEEYNKKLEIKVEERTIELKNAMTLQKTILDSVDQGFVLVDKDLSVSNIYSKASVEVFCDSPDKMSLDQLLHVPSSESETLNSFFGMIFDGMMSFSDLTSVAPQNFVNNNERQISLGYLKPEEDDSKIVIVATDKTDEIEALEKAKIERAFVKFILKAVENKGLFVKFYSYLNETYKSLKETNDSGEMNREKLFSVVHTLKGNAGVYNLKRIVDKAHVLEDALGPEKFDKEICSPMLSALVEICNVVIKEIDDAIGEFIAEEPDGINEKDLRKLLQMNLPSEAKDFVSDLISSISVESLFKHMKFITEETATKLSKDIKIEFDGDIRFEKEFMDVLEESVVHLVNNSIDHGIEKNGVINIKAYIDDQSKVLEISDNGNGIDASIIREKAIEKGLSTDGKNDDDILNLIFEQGFSTKSEVTLLSGRGVGLAQVKDAIVEKGGQIKVESKIGEGTKFTIKKAA